MRLLLLFFMLALSSCINAKPNLEVARNTAIPNNPFNDALRTGYIDLSEAQWLERDNEDSKRYAQKATIAAKGFVPDMEALYTRKLTIKDLNELLGAKYFIESAFVNGMKEQIPTVAASAQVNFDCWVEIAEEGIEKHPDNLCKEKVMKASAAMSQRLDAMKKREREIAEQRKQEALAQKEAEFKQQLAKEKARLRKKYNKMPQPAVIFFGFNQTNLDIKALGLLEKVAKDIEVFRPRKVIISGNADNVGSYDYNMRIALKRAQVVADHLVSRYGISPGILDVKAYGKNNPRQKHNDATQDIRNRYVEIIFLNDDRLYYIDQ